ncbi:HmuY family protein [Chitinophaga nivalis]|uniref:HmuY family protein n=1 Tax=Chitinophaga nivalis TaxID=2991709 RepID=A0ABT3IGT5_9BACT|nr:HmuY family protein [Chitinophaga nivalis]MCW3467329.1 HmuY family protein [Chitinophaga nivalis]MCW3482979.1 HmuY family protein [Chitinophaga nivalis]
MRKSSIFLAACLLAMACRKSETAPDSGPPAIAKEQFIKNIESSYSKQVFINFKTGQLTTQPEGTNWDLGFYSAQLKINGGPMTNPVRDGRARAAILPVAYKDLKELPDLNGLKQDIAGEDFALGYRSGGKSWYYMTDEMVYIPYPGKCIFLQTADGEGFVKMEILSYYRDMPSLKGQTYKTLSEREGFITIRYQYIGKNEKFQ